MNIEFDGAKNEKNIHERGISFELAADFDLATAKIWIDARNDYGEEGSPYKSMQVVIFIDF